MTTSPSKVAICFPSADMVHADFALALAGLCSETEGVALSIVNSKASIVAVARNDGVAKALELGADHILFLDSDMVFPRTTLSRLLSHGKDVVGATYTKRVPPFEILGTSLAQRPECDERNLIEMKRLPTGCLLIRTSVFDGLRRPYFRFSHDETTGAIFGEDYVFCDRIREMGISIWCDTELSLQVGHIGQYVFDHRMTARRNHALPPRSDGRTSTFTVS